MTKINIMEATLKPNSKRFIDAFNQIDYALRAQHNFKRSMNFSDMIRRSTALSSVVRKYEEDLIDYSRLRNAIIHNSNDEYIIAEPHDDVTQKIERLAKIITTPPFVLDAIHKNDVLVVEHDVKVVEVIKLIAKTGYSNIPVYQNNSLVGIANGQRLLNKIGYALEGGKNINDFICENNILNLVQPDDNKVYYAVANDRLTIEEALNMFYSNRKLLVVLITRTGSTQEPPIGIVTTSDIMDMNTILDNY